MLRTVDDHMPNRVFLISHRPVPPSNSVYTRGAILTGDSGRYVALSSCRIGRRSYFPTRKRLPLQQLPAHHIFIRFEVARPGPPTGRTTSTSSTGKPALGNGSRCSRDGVDGLRVDRAGADEERPVVFNQGDGQLSPRHDEGKRGGGSSASRSVANELIFDARANRRGNFVGRVQPGLPEVGIVHELSRLKNLERVKGIRTLVFSLEGCCSTIELHPRCGEH